MDSEPLKSIFQKLMILAPEHLQRMPLGLPKFDVEVKCVGGKSVLLTNTLSRLVDIDRTRPISGLDVTITYIPMIKIETMLLISLQEDTNADPTLKDPS